MAEVETLEDWSEEQKSALETAATAKYGLLSESIRSSMAEATMCSMFCGGKNCKYESATKWSKEQQAVNGLYSNWITSNILGMARPNTEQIEKYSIMDQFSQLGIRSIINLQLVGEHASCGPSLHPSGFTYVPQDFMDRDVFFYNFGWHDYNVGSLVGIVDAVRVMQFALSQGKVAIHCHAGLGRTGVLIACYLIFANRLDPDIAINYVRRKRPGSVQSRCQIKCIRDFAEFLRPSRIIFSSVKPKLTDFTLGQFLNRQKFAIHGNEARYLRYLPKIIYVCCERLLETAGRQCTDETHKARLFIASNRFISHDSTLAHDNLFHSAIPLDEVAARPANNRSQLVAPQTPLMSAMAMRASISFESLLPIRKQVSGTLGRHSPSSTAVSMTVGPGSNGSGLLPIVNHSLVNTMSKTDVDHLPAIATSRRSSRRVSVASTALTVIDALGGVRADCSPESLIRVDEYKTNINKSATEWWQLRMENDPTVLATLLWDWLDELREPILSIQDLPVLLAGVRQPVASLNYLEKGVRQTVCYLFYVIACLEPIGQSQRECIIQRAISTLTHQSMVTELDDVVRSSTLSYDETQRLHSRSMNDGRMKSDVARLLREFFEAYLRQIKVCPCVAERSTSRRLNIPPAPGSSRSQHRSAVGHQGEVSPAVNENGD